MTRFKDRVVVVLGGNSGIGLAAAELFATEGASLAITGRNAETLRAAAQDIGGDCLAITSDIADLAATRSAIDAIEQRYGRIDVLFVNAGVGAFIPIEQVTSNDWDRLFGVNLKGAYFAIQQALPLMAAGSSIVLCSSIGGRKGLSGNSVYGATKAGLSSLALTLGAELVGRGIRVNAVSPGPTETPIITRTAGLPEEAIPATLAMMRDVVPMKRMAAPAEIARAVLFLASDDASFITGQDLLVDGGLCNF